MPAIVILRESSEVTVADAIRNDLAAREWSVTVDSFASHLLEPERLMKARLPSVLAFIPKGEVLRQRCLNRLKQLVEARIYPVLVIPDDTELPSWLYEQGVRSIVSAGSVTYDRLFEDIFRGLVGPLPSWLDVRVRPTQMLRPTGVSWWTEDVYVADERFEHVVRIGTVDSQVVLPGLFEPHHIHLDRRLLCVANKSANEILLAQIVDDMAVDVRSLVECGPTQLKMPHDVCCHRFMLAVADTDNHRVLLAHGNNFERAEWKPAEPLSPLQAPCGLHVDQQVIWVADTFNHRLIAFDHGGRQIAEFGSYGDELDQFRFPVGVYSWYGYLFVADEESERLKVYRKTDGGELLLEVLSLKFGAPWVQQPFGLSVNRENRLAIGDRKQKCVWIIDLYPALDELGAEGNELAWLWPRVHDS